MDFFHRKWQNECSFDDYDVWLCKDILGRDYLDAWIHHDDPTHPANDPAYANLIKVPNGESLADTLVRVKECWEEYLVPAINNNRRLLVVAHGNSLRALMKLLENLSEDEILNRDIPTAMPLRYKLNNDLSVLKTSFLVETEELEAAMKRARG